MTHLLDTDHTSIWERAKGPEYLALVANLNRHGATDVAVSVVSLHEQANGCNTVVAQARKPADLLYGYKLFFRLIDAFRQFPPVKFDAQALVEFDRLRAAKVRIGTMDLRIAATALAHNLTVVTRNVSDFGKVPGLRTEDWTK